MFEHTLICGGEREGTWSSPECILQSIFRIQSFKNACLIHTYAHISTQSIGIAELARVSKHKHT